MRLPTAIALLLLPSLPAVQAASEPPQSINLADFPAESLDNVVVPVPSEVFAVLDKLGNPNWHRELLGGTVKASSNRTRVALLLGTVIADGFVAVEAEDSERVKEIGRDVLKLAAAINVRKSVVARSKSITDKADARQWNAVRQELDGALSDVRTAMNELNDGQLAQLVSLAGWLRGTMALTSIVDQDYSTARAELLHQPLLLEYFLGQIEAMPPRLRDYPLVARIRKALLEIRPLIDLPDGTPVPPESVKRIQRITRDLVTTIRSTGA